MVIATIAYTYVDSNWKVKTAHNRPAISYDVIGNPIYDGTWSYTWEKDRQFKQMSKSGTVATFLYNTDGLRIRKTVGGMLTSYTLHGKNIAHLIQGSSNLHFFYDAQNRPAVVNFNGTKYGYIVNLQGDVLGLIDSTRIELVKYTYGCVELAPFHHQFPRVHLGYYTALRYRGYVYDVETGLYYLRSRYYNPEWGRFINADALFNGNVYCYCNNNPLLYLDENGTYPDIINYMRAMFKLHEKVVQKVCSEVNGLSARVDAQISGAGLHGGMGYPDVIDHYGHVWEVKPLSIYGMISGARQMKNYTTGTGKTRGYPIHIDPFEDELLGVKGIVFVFNGAIPDFDTGVVYYCFIPKTEYSLAVNPEYVQKEDNSFQQTTVFIGNPGYTFDFDNNSGTSAFAKALVAFGFAAIGGISLGSSMREMHYGGCSGGGLFYKKLDWE